VSDRDAVVITYDGSPATATFDIDYSTRSGVFSTTVTGGTGSSISPLDLADSAYDTTTEFCDYIDGQTGYTCSTDSAGNGNALTITYEDVDDVDISGAGGSFDYDADNFFYEEMALSKQVIEANLSGYSCDIFSFPYTYEDETSRAAVKTAGYKGSRAGGGYGVGGGTRLKDVDVFNLGTRCSRGNWCTFSAGDWDNNIMSFFESVAIGGRTTVIYVHGVSEMTMLQWTDVFDIAQELGANIITAQDFVNHVDGTLTGLLPVGTLAEETSSMKRYTRTFDTPNYRLLTGAPSVNAGTSVWSGPHLDFYGLSQELIGVDPVNLGVSQNGSASLKRAGPRSMGQAIFGGTVQ
jgi:hypothetical protein